MPYSFSQSEHPNLLQAERQKSKHSTARGIAFIILSFPIVLFAANESTNPAADQNLQQQLQYLQQAVQQQSSTNSQNMTLPATTYTTPQQPVAVSQTNGMPNAAMPIGADTGAVSQISSSADDADNPEDILGGSDLRSQAFTKMVNTTLPLSPAQIRLLRNMYDATQQAAVIYPGTPPHPTASSLLVDLSPGATPPVVRLSAGFVTSLVFVDSTGAPWPIDSYSLGNPTAFNIQWDKKGNILLVQAITAHRIGNLAVILKGLNTPIMVNLSPGQAAMDMRVDMRVPGFGPDAKPTLDTLPGTESPVLLSLLDGIPPAGAKNLKTTSCENCVWLVDKKLYLRTQFTVLSPAWISTMSSADGTHVYEMQPTPLVLASYNGKTIQIKIEGF